MDHHVATALPLLEAALYRRNAQTSEGWRYHNHVLQGNALRFMTKELLTKEMVGEMRSTLVQGTRNGVMASLFISEISELSMLRSTIDAEIESSSSAVNLPFPHIINVSGLDCDGAVQRWQLALSSAEVQAQWHDALVKAKEFVSLVEHSGEKELVTNIFKSLVQKIRTGPNISGLKIHQASFKGSKVIKYLSRKLDYTTTQAHNIASNMLNLRLLEHVENAHAFHGDNKHLYRFNKRMLATLSSSQSMPISGGGTNSLLATILLPINIMGKESRSESIVTSDSGAAGAENVNDGSWSSSEAMSPTTIHLLRLRRQAQSELKEAMAAIENLQAQIDNLVALNQRNVAKGDLLVVRTRRVELLNGALQVFLAFLSAHSLGLFPDLAVFHSAPIFVAVLTILCSGLYHFAPAYRSQNGSRLVGSTKELVFEESLSVDSSSEPPQQGGKDQIRADRDEGEDEEDDDEEDEEEDEEDDEEEEETLTPVDPQADVESSPRQPSRKTSGSIFRTDFARLKKVHELVSRVKSQKRQVSSPPVPRPKLGATLGRVLGLLRPAATPSSS